MKVCIDPGHGGNDPGAIGTDPFRLEEKGVNLSVSLLLEEELENMGHWTALTRRRDIDLSLESRAEFANRLDADLFVSVHVNAADSPSVEGMEAYHYPNSNAGQNAANLILTSLLDAFPEHKNRGVKQANFAVLRLTKMPAVLVEMEFLSNPDQLQFLADESNQKGLAEAMAIGINQVTVG
ncbi:MAG: N-acetylmuramoyl-L-alanine amidase [bacterium]